MKRVLSLLALALLATSAQAVPATKVFPYAVRREVLPNGLKVLMVPMPSEGLVSYWSIVRTGSRDEVEQGVTGFAHFFEHIMFKGSKKYPGPVYDSMVAAMGANANAFTSDDLTAYHLSLTKQDLPKVIDMESDRFQHLEYSEPEFRTESGAVYGEYRKGKTSPFSVLNEATQNAAFDKHTYKHTTIGFEADIKRMPEQYAYSKTFFKRFYRPENVVLLIAGDFDPDATMALIRQAYGPWTKGYVPPTVTAEPEQTKMRRIDVPFEGETLPIVTVNWKGPRFSASDRETVAGLLIQDLAFGETSPLYRKLVLDQQRVETLDGDFGMSRDPGLWSAYSSVKDGKDIPSVEAELFGAVEEIRMNGVSQERLDAAKSRRKYGFLSRLETPDALASSLARWIALTGDLTAVDEMSSTLDQVTVADVRAAANRWLTPQRSTVAILHAAGAPLVDPTSAEPPVLLPVASDPNVAIKLWFKVGSQDDPAGKEGLASLTAALLAEGGTAQMAYDEILKRLYPLAADYGVNVDREMTVATGRCHRDVVPQFYPLFTAAIMNPGFRADDFERLRARAISTLEKQLRFSSDEELGKAALYGFVFGGAPYAHHELGTVAALKAITLDDVRNFYKTHYTKDNAVLALGGAYDDKLPKLLAADVSRMASGKPAAAAPSAPASLPGRNVLIVEKPGQSTAMSLGHPLDVHRGSKDFYALWVANSWLGEHRNQFSHLYQVIRERRGMNYGDYSYIEAFPRGGRLDMPPTGVGRKQQIFEVWLRPVPHERAPFAIRAALREIESLVKNGLTKEQFEEARNFLKKYSLHFAETNAQRLGYAVDDRFYGIGGEGHLAKFRKTMDELTQDDVNTAIRKYIHPEELDMAFVTSDANRLKEALVSAKPTPIDYAGIEKPAAQLEEDKEIAKYPFGVTADKVRIVKVDEMFAK